MRRARVAAPIFVAILFARLLVLLVHVLSMDGKNAYFEAALAAIPPQETNIIQQRRLGFIEVLGNLPEAKITKIFGTPSEELKTAIELATAITEGDLLRIEQIGLPKPKKIKVEEPQSIISILNKRPLKLPNKAHNIIESSAVPSAKEPITPLTSKKDIRIAHALEEWWVIFGNLGSFGAIWSDNMEKDSYKVDSKAVLFDDWARNQAMVAHLKYVQEWIKWCEDKTLPWKTPDSISVRAFIKSYEKRGATVPKGVFNALRWAQMNIGIHFTTDLQRVKRAA